MTNSNEKKCYELKNEFKIRQNVLNEQIDKNNDGVKRTR